jgi:hypothetical protein
MAAVVRGDLKVGDRVVGFDNFRGEIVEIYPMAGKWPYVVEDAAGIRELFNGNEIELVVEDPIKEKEVKDALALVQAEIAETEAKLEWLKLTRRVLEGFKN